MLTISFGEKVNDSVNVNYPILHGFYLKLSFDYQLLIVSLPAEITGVVNIKRHLGHSQHKKKTTYRQSCEMVWAVEVSAPADMVV